MSRLTLSLLILALLACPLAAADARLAGPVSGFFFDAGSHSLRPMIGVPGSSWLGDPLAAELDYAAMAPNGKAALAARAGRLYLIAGLDRFELQWNELGAALEGLDRIAWSADSSAAIVANSASGRLQRWSKLNTAPESADPLELAGRLLALVLDETGGTAVAGVADSGMYLLTAGSVRQISRMAQPVSLALAGNDLYVANRAASEILAIPRLHRRRRRHAVRQRIDGRTGSRRRCALGRRQVARSRKRCEQEPLAVRSHCGCRAAQVGSRLHALAH